jgi:hypothetical protein
MSDIIERLLLRNLHEVFGQGDPVRRRAAIGKSPPYMFSSMHRLA